MTVKNLIDKLSTIDPDAEVRIIKYSFTTDGIIKRIFNIDSVGFETKIYSDKNEIEAFIEI